MLFCQNLCAKRQIWVSEPHFREVRGDARLWLMARWKAHGRLPIRRNWMFSLSITRPKITEKRYWQLGRGAEVERESRRRRRWGWGVERWFPSPVGRGSIFQYLPRSGEGIVRPPQKNFSILHLKVVIFSAFWTPYFTVQLHAESCRSCRKFKFSIFQGSVATCLRRGEYCRTDFVANFMRFPAVQKFWKSVKIWQRYREFKGGNFFETNTV